MNSVPVLRPRGEIDIAAVAGLRTPWLALADEGHAELIVVDLCEVTFMDVAGAGLLVALRNRQRVHGGKVHLRRVPRQVARLLQLTGLSGSFPVEPAPAPRAASEVIDLRSFEGEKQLRD